MGDTNSIAPLFIETRLGEEIVLSIAEAKRLVLGKYGFSIIVKPALGKWMGGLINGEAYPPSTLVIWSGLELPLELVTIAHEAGHLIAYRQNKKEYLHGNRIELETKAWENGLPIAIELGIYEKYSACWKEHLDELLKYF